VHRKVLAWVIMLFASRALAQDPVQTDGDKYRVLLENECVRVLDYQDQPGEMTRQHRHPPFVLYALSSFKRAIRLPDGKVLRREFKQGDVLWSPEQTHVGENIGATPTHVVIVELKQSDAAGAGCAKR
jgi:beta-alanine degradation protein BauB